MLWKILLFAVIGIGVGILLGKNILDAISSLKKQNMALAFLLVGVDAIALLMGTILWKGFRIPCAVALVLMLLCTWASFRYLIEYNTKYGIRVKWNASIGTVLPDQSFDKNRPETGYDLYLPAKKSEDGTYGLAVYLHGGGFSGGSKKAGDGWCKFTTSKGYVSLTMDYTLANKDSQSNLHLMVDEIVDCVAAAKEKCASLGYELTEMTLSGGSAGGCLAALYAYGKADVSPIPVKFVFQESGPMYFDPIWWGSLHDAKGQANFVAMMTGKQVTEEMVQRGEHIPLFEAISPASLVKDGDVPMLSAYGAFDTVVQPQLKYRLFEALERHHVPYEDVEYPNSGHMLYSDPKAQKTFLAKLDSFFETYFDHKPMKGSN